MKTKLKCFIFHLLTFSPFWNSPDYKLRYFEERERNRILPITLPAKADFLVKHKSPVERPGRATLKPALAAENWRQAGRSRHVAGGAALAQVGQQESWTGALTHSVDLSRWLSVPNVAHSFPKVSRVTELLQLHSTQQRPVLTSAVEDHREVAVTQSCLTELRRKNWNSHMPDTAHRSHTCAYKQSCFVWVLSTPVISSFELK